MNKRTLIILFLLVTGYVTTYAQDAKYKALFIYNFTKHIDWPAEAKTGDFIIGIVGHNELYTSLSGITTGKKAGSQNIVVKKYKNPEEISDDCQILFVGTGQSGGSKFEMVMSKTNGKSTLIVTERSGMAKKGAIINFVVQAGKIKFELNKANASQHNLTISSYLENLAIII